MKQFKIPLIDKQFRIYIGQREWEAFCKYCVFLGMDKNNVEKKAPIGGSGRCWGGAIWVNRIKDRPTLFHELSHFIDDLMGMIDKNQEKGEFRAYLTEWVYEKSLLWFEKEKVK